MTARSCKCWAPSPFFGRETDRIVSITSYQEVAKAHPSEEKLKRIASMKLNDEDWAEEFDKELGWLMQRQFYRVILDEAHAIKNQHSRSRPRNISLRSSLVSG